MFAAFSSKIFDAISSSVRGILQQLSKLVIFFKTNRLIGVKVQTSRGVTNAIVVHDNNDDGGVVMPTQEEDQLGIVANLLPLITLSNDISNY